MINTYNLKAREKNVSWFSDLQKKAHSQETSIFLYLIGITGGTKAEQNDGGDGGNKELPLSNLEVINKKLKRS